METAIINNILSQIGPDETAKVLEKGMQVPIGEIRTWGNKKYQKTATGWKYLGKEGSKSDEQSKQGIEPEHQREFFQKFVSTLEKWNFPVHGYSIKKNKTGYTLKAIVPVDQSWIPISDTMENQEKKMKTVLDKHKEDLDKLNIKHKIDMVSGGRGTIDLVCYFKIKNE